MILNIHSKKSVIELCPKKYHFYILDGFGIELNSFSIELVNVITQEKLNARKSFWPIQSFWQGRRSKRTFTVHVLKQGHHKIIVHRPEKLEVKKGKLLIHQLFSNSISNNEIEILIRE